MSITFGGGNPWHHVQPWDRELFGEHVQDEEVRRPWERAFRIAGGLPYIWQELARPVSEIAYGLLEVRPGDRVLLIGEGIGPAGWLEDLRAAVGPSGEVHALEIIQDGRRAVSEGRVGRNGMIGCWRWDYADGLEADSFDAVAILQSTQHADDWTETGRDLLRVLKPGRRIVLAEAVMAGPTFEARINADVHLRQWYDKLYAQFDPGGVSYYTGEQLMAALDGQLDSPQTLEWKGIEMFWGRKPQA